MLDNLKKYNVVLASNSPRRKELLQRLGIPFKVRTLFGIDESYPDTLRGEDIVRYISRNKANAYRSSMGPDELLITADTIVYLDGRVLGKPKDEADARAMLSALSGRSHEVYTGVTVMLGEDTLCEAECTKVFFRELSAEEIDAYVASGDPMDKAGAYGIQGRAALMVEKIEGDYFNVMGLPLCRLGKMLKTIGVRLL